MIDLGESTPFVECKFKDKTYRVYANDKNIMQIEKLVAFYRAHVDKLNELDKRDTAALNGDKSVKPIDSEEFREIGKQLIDETKAAIFDVFDDLLQEPGIGEAIWKSKKGSTEYLVFTLGQIQSELRAVQGKYEHDKEKALEKAYPVHQARPNRNQHRNNYKK